MLFLLLLLLTGVESRQHFVTGALKVLELERANSTLQGGLGSDAQSDGPPAGYFGPSEGIDFDMPEMLASIRRARLLAIAKDNPWVLALGTTLGAAVLLLVLGHLGATPAPSAASSPQPTEALLGAVPGQPDNAPAASAELDGPAGKLEQVPKVTEPEVQAEAGAAKALQEAQQPGLAKKAEVPQDRFSFGAARFLASMHVVSGHLLSRKMVRGTYLFEWGFTWVPWFFMLSGFILFTAEVRRPRKEPPLTFIARRAVAIFPLYAFGLVVALLMLRLSRVQIDVNGMTLALQSWLLQAWVPQVTERTTQMHCWFLSCMVPYWGVFGVLHRWISSLDLGGILRLAVGLVTVPWLLPIIPAIVYHDSQWYTRHWFGFNRSFLDTAVVMLKFHPLCYFHVFVLGMVLGRLRLLLEGVSHNPRVRPVMEWLAPIGYLILGVVFTVPAVRPWGDKLTARLVLLLPMQAACMLGLAGLPGAEPPTMAKVLAPLNFLESYSYSVYVLQFIAMGLWPTAQVDAWFYVFLIGMAVLAVHLVQKPAEKLWNRNPVMALLAGPPCLLCMLLLLNVVVPHPQTLQAMKYLKVQEGVVDVQLPLTLPAGQEGWDLLRPSLVFLDGEVLVAVEARQTQWHVDFDQGSHRLVTEHIDNSQIMTGTFALSQADVVSWVGGGDGPPPCLLSNWTGLQTSKRAQWQTDCYSEQWYPIFNAVDRRHVRGPQAPRVIVQADARSPAARVAIVFDSFPPGQQHCNMEHTLMEKYYAEGVDFEHPGQPVRALMHPCSDAQLAARMDEWIPFKNDAKLFFITSVQPHAVVQSSGDACGRRHTSSFGPLASLLEQSPHLAIEGAAQAVFVDEPTATPSLPLPHFLALLTVRDQRHPNRRAHFAYRFSASEPFQVLQVSSQLPLQRAAGWDGDGFAAPAGLALRGRQLLISYSAGFDDVRALLLDLEQLDEAFFARKPEGVAAWASLLAENARVQRRRVAAAKARSDWASARPPSLFEVAPDGAAWPWRSESA